MAVSPAQVTESHAQDSNGHSPWGGAPESPGWEAESSRGEPRPGSLRADAEQRPVAWGASGAPEASVATGTEQGASESKGARGAPEHWRERGPSESEGERGPSESERGREALREGPTEGSRGGMDAGTAEERKRKGMRLFFAPPLMQTPQGSPVLPGR